MVVGESLRYSRTPREIAADRRNLRSGGESIRKQCLHDTWRIVGAHVNSCAAVRAIHMANTSLSGHVGLGRLQAEMIGVKTALIVTQVAEVFFAGQRKPVAFCIP
jgi:hypothetical protein